MLRWRFRCFSKQMCNRKHAQIIRKIHDFNKWNSYFLRISYGVLALSLLLPGCTDDAAADTSGETSTMVVSDSLPSDSDLTSDGPAEDPFEPWYGTWFWIDPRFTINEHISKINGADGLGMTQVDFARGIFTIRYESCLWGPSRYEYRSRVDEAGVLVLDPVDPANQSFMNAYKKLFVVVGPDCGELRLKGIRSDEDEEVELLTETSGPLRRGVLCLQCPQKDVVPGVISDCGTPVPWACPALVAARVHQRRRRGY
jgi:hypothetical protein